MPNKVISFLKNTFRDRFRRHLIMSVVVLGIVLVAVSHWGAGSNSVMPEEPPVMEALEVTKDRHGHCYLIQQDGLKYKVGREQKYDIECITSHPDGFELSYEWEWYAGEISAISEDGSVITWTAPNTSGDVTLVVTVSDIAGNTVQWECNSQRRELLAMYVSGMLRDQSGDLHYAASVNEQQDD